MDCAKGRAVADLYDEVMVEILSRVPVKDLRRCTCVCKSWRNLITDPLNRKKLPQTLEGFFHGVVGGPHSYGQFTSLSGSGERVAPVDPSFSFITAMLPGVERMVLLDSCNGLLLFGCTREDKFGYIVTNPATEELMTVPASSGSCPLPPPFERDMVGGERYAHTFLMFNPAVSSHFHLVQIWENKAAKEVETLHSYSSETKAWSDRSSKWGRGEEGGEWELWGESVIGFMCGWTLVDGLLHFLAFDLQKEETVIIAVDGEGETRRIIGWHGKDVRAIVFIGESQDHLHCIGVNVQLDQGSEVRFTRMSIWVLEDYDTQAWILKHNVSSLQFFELLSHPIKDFHIVAIHPYHNSFILIQHWNQKLVSYNMDTQELHGLRTLGKGYAVITPYIPCFLESSVLATKH
ncbi:F-box/kelch-repeat protein [Zea mays]|uniref:F-box/kelch-repeat protein n=1 Tax=Zea mays TaxID=4577 RepID=A0A3L6E2F7_MAIZE|nr:F-box/kelch-repeat protein [Zea mays]